jgi:hypothetical protein
MWGLDTFFKKYLEILCQVQKKFKNKDAQIFFWNCAIQLFY